MTRFALSLLVLSAGTASAQPQNAANKAEMKKLEFLAGKWTGPATVSRGKETTTLKQTEEVQFKLDATVLLVEGTGRGKLPGTDQEGIVFNALAVISYDTAAKKYRIKAYRMEGTSVEADLTVTEKGFNWGFSPPNSKVQVRYAMTITAKGEWHEIGEFSQDGQTWNKFFEMTLTRVKE